MLFTEKIILSSQRLEKLREIQMLPKGPSKFCYDTISGMSIFLIFGTVKHGYYEFQGISRFSSL